MDDMKIRQDANGNYVITLPRQEMRDLLYVMGKGLSQIADDKMRHLMEEHNATAREDNDTRILSRRNYNVYVKIDNRIRPIVEQMRKRFSVLDYASRH